MSLVSKAVKSLEVIALSAFLWLSPVKAEPYQGPSAGSAPLTVPDDAYPDGEAQIWIPSIAETDAYLTNTDFVPSPLVTSTTLELATPADVDTDITRFGYPTSTKPPAFVPVISYATETPSFPFVGQMVPGTDIHYATPEIEPVWL